MLLNCSFRRAVMIAMTLLYTLFLIACGTPTQSSLSDACPTMVQGTSVPECTMLNDGVVALNLPPDTDTHSFGAITRNGMTFLTAGGKSLPLSSAVSDTLSQSIATQDTAYANLVYYATVANGQVTSLEPALHVTEDAILNHMFAGRSLVGTISPRNSDGTYSFDATLPVAVQFDAQASNGEIHGQIVNAESSALTPAGECIRALPTDAGNPLADGFTKDIIVTRVPSMHAAFNDELVLAWNDSSSGMGHDFYPSVATLLGADALEDNWTVVQHGNPTSGPLLELQFADGMIKAASC